MSRRAWAPGADYLERIRTAVTDHHTAADRDLVEAHDMAVVEPHGDPGHQPTQSMCGARLRQLGREVRTMPRGYASGVGYRTDGTPIDI
jgi:hypothetical protein